MKLIRNYIIRRRIEHWGRRLSILQQNYGILYFNNYLNCKSIPGIIKHRITCYESLIRRLEKILK